MYDICSIALCVCIMETDNYTVRVYSAYCAEIGIMHIVGLYCTVCVGCAALPLCDHSAIAS